MNWRMDWRKVSAASVAAGMAVAACGDDDTPEPPDPMGMSGAASSGTSGQSSGGDDQGPEAGQRNGTGGSAGGPTSSEAGEGGALVGCGPADAAGAGGALQPVGGGPADAAGAGGASQPGGGGPADAAGAGGALQSVAGAPAAVAGASTDGGAGNDGSAHCTNQAHDADESGVDCGGEDCADCAPCSSTFPLNSEFEVEVTYTVRTLADASCQDSTSTTRKSSVVKIGTSASELEVDGEAVWDYRGSQTVGSVTTFTYETDPPDYYGGPCPFIGYLDQRWSSLTLYMSLNADTGQVKVTQSCNDAAGLCFADGLGYQDSSLRGEGWNVCR